MKFNKMLILSVLIMLISNYLFAQKSKEVTGLKVGDKVKDFLAKDLEGKPYALSTALQNGPVVVIFYRGQWCPVCNKHLSMLEENLEKIYATGATIIAVSPEKTELMKKTVEKTKATFTLLHDEGYAISDLFDVTFEPTGTEKLAYNTGAKANLKEAHSDDSQRLPIPATFIIGQDSKIVWRQFDPNYKKRSSIEDIIANIPKKVK